MTTDILQQAKNINKEAGDRQEKSCTTCGKSKLAKIGTVNV